jgi:DNA-binding transcriptional ArsR family regulator
MRRDTPAPSAGAALPALHRITTLAALRAVSDDQRQRLLTLLILRPLGARELAQELRMSRPKAYYHLNLLEEQGLIRVVAHRASGRQLERVYRAVARGFRVENALLEGGGRRGVMSARAQILRNAIRDLEGLSAPSPRHSSRTLVSRVLVRLQPAQMVELRKRLAALIDGLKTTQEEGEPMEVVVALFPSENAVPARRGRPSR